MRINDTILVCLSDLTRTGACALATVINCIFDLELAVFE